MRYSLNNKMKIFKFFFLYLFFNVTGIFPGFAQDSVLVSFPNGLSAFIKLHVAEVMPSTLQQRFPTIKVWKSTHKLFPKVDFRILKLNNEWEIYAIKGDSITKFTSKKEGVWDSEFDDDFNESVKCFTSTSNNFQQLDNGKSLCVDFQTFIVGNLCCKVDGITSATCNLINADNPLGKETNTESCAKPGNIPVTLKNR